MRIYVRVVPKSSQNKVERISEGEYKIWTTAPPVDGKANDAVLRLLSNCFDVSKSKIKIIGGKTARIKIVEIE